MTLEEHVQCENMVCDYIRERGVTKIYRNMEYDISLNGKRYIGEVDVLFHHPSHNYWVFVEVKSKPWRQWKAQEQYDRFKECHPGMPLKGVFVSYGKVRRLQ